jgi:hypothetical protein
MAVDATGTPTSPDNIPTYNTAVDAPSGKGFNAAMALIQTALSTRVNAPAGIVSGEVPVWNGAAWVRSSVTPVNGNNVSNVSKAPYRKNTAKVVVNTTTETDLLNGEITVGANAVGVNGVLRLTAVGDLINNTGGTVATPRFKLKLGATTILDSGAFATIWASQNFRFPWRLDVFIQNLGAANSQWSDFRLNGAFSTISNNAAGVTTGEGMMQTLAADFDFKVGMSGPSAVDTTAAQVLALTVILPTANALEDVTLKNALVEIL